MKVEDGLTGSRAGCACFEIDKELKQQQNELWWWSNVC